MAEHSTSRPFEHQCVYCGEPTTIHMTRRGYYCRACVVKIPGGLAILAALDRAVAEADLAESHAGAEEGSR